MNHKKGRFKIMKKILFEGFLVAVFLLNGVLCAQNIVFDTNDLSFALSKNSQNILSNRLSKFHDFRFKTNYKLKKIIDQIPFLVDTVTAIETKENYRYSFTYDSKGKVKTQLKEILKNNKYENYERDNYSFDYESNTESHRVQRWENGEWKLVGMSTRTYDSNGNEIQYLFFSDYPDGIWKPDFRVTISYYFDRVFSCILDEIYYEGSWRNLRRTTQAIDDKIHRTTGLIDEIWANDKWNIVENSMHYDYDALADTTVIVTKIWKDNNWINHGLEKYVANSDNGNKTSIQYKWHENNWDLDLKWNLIYKHNGTEVVFISESWSNNQCDSISKRTHLYDLNGAILASNEELYKNGQWSNKLKENYSYDDNGSVVKFESRVWNGSVWLPENSVFGLEYIHNGFWGSDVTLQYKSYDQLVGIKESKFPSGFELHQNYPNPFNPVTTIQYSIPGNVETLQATSLRVYDILGREVAVLVNQKLAAGNYEVKFDASHTEQGRSMASGVYLYKLQSGSFIQTKKFVLMK